MTRPGSVEPTFLLTPLLYLETRHLVSMRSTPRLAVSARSGVRRCGGRYTSRLGASFCGSWCIVALSDCLNLGSSVKNTHSPPESPWRRERSWNAWTAGHYKAGSCCGNELSTAVTASRFTSPTAATFKHANTQAQPTVFFLLRPPRAFLYTRLSGRCQLARGIAPGAPGRLAGRR